MTSIYSNDMGAVLFHALKHGLSDGIMYNETNLLFNKTKFS